MFALAEKEQGLRTNWFSQWEGEGGKLLMEAPNPGKGGPQALTSTHHLRTGLRSSHPGTASVQLTTDSEALS